MRSTSCGSGTAWGRWPVDSGEKIRSITCIWDLAGTNENVEADDTAHWHNRYYKHCCSYD